MSFSKKHLQWLHCTNEEVTISTGEKVPVYEFAYDVENEEIMSLWAKHFRNHYCADDEIEILKPPEMSNSDYLLKHKFPDGESRLGPSIRSGDFAEILVADYLEFLLNYYVPRTRYDRKTIGNESTKGSDILAFKQENKDVTSKNDELVVYEVKARLSENKPNNTLQKAIDDSSKDEVRLAESLNGAKQRLFDKGETRAVKIIARFQQGVDYPYQTIYGAAAVMTDSSCCIETLAESSTDEHAHKEQLKMIVIKGPELMSLVNKLYERAANEA